LKPRWQNENARLRRTVVTDARGARVVFRTIGENMRLCLLIATFIWPTWAAGADPAHLPTSPEGARTRWVVKQPYEIVAYVTLDPATVENVVRVAFAGYCIQECGSETTWSIQGTHPLAGGVVLRPSTFQFGYDLKGGSYPRGPVEK
jgi:hypothetical protein